MSITEEAINALVKTEATNATNAALNAATPALAGLGIFAQHQDMKTIDLEDKLPLRRRARGSMETNFVTPFASYALEHAQPGATVFIDAEGMYAKAVLNLGSNELPGHCDNLSKVKLKRTAAYEALLRLIGTTQSQRSFAEWLEEWGILATCWEDLPAQPEGEAQESTKGKLDMKACIAAIRSVTIEKIQKNESEVSNFSQNRTAAEQIALAARAEQKLPSFLLVTFKPYKELGERTFAVRVSAVTSRTDPEFRLNVLGMEAHQEEMAEEFAQAVRDAFTSMDPTPADKTVPAVLVGTYTKAG